MIEGNGIELHYRDEGGLHSGIATLRQLLREYGRRLPRLVIEGADLTGIQALLAREGLQIGDPVGPRALEHCSGLLGSGLEGLDLADPGSELECEALQLCPSVSGVRRRLGALAGAPLELVEPGDRLVERRGAEEDCDRIGLSLLVESPQAVTEEALGRLQIARDDLDFLLDPLPLELEGLGPATEACQLAPGPREARIQGVEAQQGRLGADRQSRPLLMAGRLGSFLRARAFSPREEDSQEKRGSERQPEREAALPTPTHGL